MPTKPTQYPEWATDGGAEITEPDAPKKASGWEDEEQPPHDFFNWYQNLAYLWIRFIAETLFSWTDLFDPMVSKIVSQPTTGGGTLVRTSGEVYILFEDRRVHGASEAKTYGASKDTYLDLSKDGVWSYSEVANGAGAPAVAADSLRVFKVVSNGTQLTSVVVLANEAIKTTRDLFAGDLNVGNINADAVQSAGAILAGGDITGLADVIANAVIEAGADLNDASAGLHLAARLGPRLRLYVSTDDDSGNSGWWLVHNAERNEDGDWVYTDGAALASFIRGRGIDFIFGSYDGADEWETADWVNKAILPTWDTVDAELRNAALELVRPSSGTDRQNPDADEAQKNRLVAKNLTKSWGWIAISDGEIIATEGFNFTAEFIGGGSPYVAITFAEAMADSHYSVSACNHTENLQDNGSLSTSSHFQARASAYNLGAGGFRIGLVTYGAGSLNSILETATGTLVLSFVVTGVQAP